MLRSRGLIALPAAGLVAAGLLAGCSEATPGEPQPGSVTETRPDGGGNTDVPKVASPLDVEPFLAKPCDLVSESILGEMGFTKPGEADIDSKEAKKLIGPSCSWFAPDGGPNMHVAIHTPKRDNGNGGLASVYENKELGIFEFLTPTEVPGHPDYPAVFAGSKDYRAEGECTMFVGISDDLEFATGVKDRNNPAAACPAAQKVAAAVIETLKEGA
ncbi:MAG: DUF3558 domain-containing protein [Pseudonocardiaceae bacterium]